MGGNEEGEMMPEILGEILFWLIVGGFVGALVGRMATGSKEGFGRFTNTMLGVAGAVVGGTLFKVFKIDLGLGELKVTLEDLIAALIGAVVVLLVVWGVRTKKKLWFWGTSAVAVTVVVIALALLSR
jgi:uncharacterized membrane protein YeaQ/YmgE (transglycosylase-associated protein family)